ncbi:MAG: hypothetical protein AABW50_05820 [Nanoarchaeota archaeon]
MNKISQVDLRLSRFNIAYLTKILPLEEGGLKIIAYNLEGIKDIRNKYRGLIGSNEDFSSGDIYLTQINNLIESIQNPNIN